MLKRGSKDKYRPLRITTICQMFWLMSEFSKGEKWNQHAPTLYKNIAFSLIENHSDSNTWEYIMANLAKFYDL